MRKNVWLALGFLALLHLEGSKEADTHFDWHAGAVEAEGEEALLSFQSLVANSKLQQQHSNTDTQPSVEDSSTETIQTRGSCTSTQDGVLYSYKKRLYVSVVCVCAAVKVEHLLRKVVLWTVILQCVSSGVETVGTAPAGGQGGCVQQLPHTWTGWRCVPGAAGRSCTGRGRWQSTYSCCGRQQESTRVNAVHTAVGGKVRHSILHVHVCMYIIYIYTHTYINICVCVCVV